MLVAGQPGEDAADENTVLTATENGFGKRTPISEYTRHGRGSKGMISIQTTERNGAVIGAALVSPKDELMLISTGGVLIRTKARDISEMGRATQGVTLISLDQGTKLAGIEKIGETDEEPANGNGNGHGEAPLGGAPDEDASGNAEEGDSSPGTDADPDAGPTIH
jgi:DNA gyrase subunit A